MTSEDSESGSKSKKNGNQNDDIPSEFDRHGDCLETEIDGDISSSETTAMKSDADCHGKDTHCDVDGKEILKQVETVEAEDRKNLGNVDKGHKHNQHAAPYGFHDITPSKLSVSSSGTRGSSIIRELATTIMKAMSFFSSREFPNDIARAKISDLDAWIHLSLTLDGRDKMMKLVQYIARFLAWSMQPYVGNHPPSSSNDRQRHLNINVRHLWIRSLVIVLIQRLQALKSCLSTSRKGFRLGRGIIELQTLRRMGLWKRFQYRSIQQQGQRVQTSCSTNTSACTSISPVKSPKTVSFSNPIDSKLSVDSLDSSTKKVPAQTRNVQTKQPSSCRSNSSHSPISFRRISSNVGLNYQTFIDLRRRFYLARHQSSSSSSSFHFMQQLLYRIPFPMLSYNNDKAVDQEDQDVTPLWETCLTVVRSLSSFIYYAGDNVSFLSSAGVLDDHSGSSSSSHDFISVEEQQKQRMIHRKQLTEWADRLANRADLVSGVIGLILSCKRYRDFSRRLTVVIREEANNEQEEEKQQTQVQSGTNTENSGLGNRNSHTGNNNRSRQGQGQEQQYDSQRNKTKQQQFTLLLSVVKNFCDVLMFTNHSGVDFWRSMFQRPLNEGIYCSAGLISAAIVLFTKLHPPPPPPGVEEKDKR